MWTPGQKLADVEKQVILKAFRYFEKNKTQTAICLGISIRTLENKLKQYADEEAKLLADREAFREKQKAESRGVPRKEYPQAPTLTQQIEASKNESASANTGTA